MEISPQKEIGGGENFSRKKVIARFFSLQRLRPTSCQEFYLAIFSRLRAD
jgi:hypothetical protein